MLGLQRMLVVFLLFLLALLFLITLSVRLLFLGDTHATIPVLVVVGRHLNANANPVFFGDLKKNGKTKMVTSRKGDVSTQHKTYQ